MGLKNQKFNQNKFNIINIYKPIVKQTNKDGIETFIHLYTSFYIG